MMRETPTLTLTEDSERHPAVERATRRSRLVGFGAWLIGWVLFVFAMATGQGWLAWAFAGWYVTLPAIVTVVAAWPRRRQAAIDRELWRRFRELSEHDDLTGLFNRRYFNGELERQIRRCHANGAPLSIAMIDLDDFKSINDSFGHPAGDVALCIAGQTIIDVAPVNATVARTGGDEFAAIMPGIAREEAEMIAARLRQAINAANFVIDGPRGGRGRICATVGIATLGEDFDPGHLLQEADSSLYARKHRQAA